MAVSQNLRNHGYEKWIDKIVQDVSGGNQCSEWCSLTYSSALGFIMICSYPVLLRSHLSHSNSLLFSIPASRPPLHSQEAQRNPENSSKNRYLIHRYVLFLLTLQQHLNLLQTHHRNLFLPIMKIAVQQVSNTIIEFDQIITEIHTHVTRFQVCFLP
jgi:hypothetical protein